MPIPQLNFSPTTPLKFLTKQTKAGEIGQGTVTDYFPIETAVAGMSVDTYWCEWRTDHGTVKATLFNSGVAESATVRMYYIPEVYNALRTEEVAIAYNAEDIISTNEIIESANPNAWQIFGQPDKVNNVMEFSVRRYEPK